MIDMVWRYKYYTAIIDACDRLINEFGEGCIETSYDRQRRKQAFQQLLDFQIAFHSKD